MMACQEGNNAMCFTFIWKIENVSYSLPENLGILESPAFIVEEICKTIWKLELTPSDDDRDGYVEIYLQRLDENEDAEIVEIDCELAFLSSDGEILCSWVGKNSVIEKDGYIESEEFVLRKEVFFTKRSVFLPQDTLTARCRLWKSVGEMTKDVQCFACTRIAVEKRSFLWNIKDFSTFNSYEVQTYEIKSHNDGKMLMTLKLSIPGGLICDELIRIKVLPNFENAKISTLKLSVLDASKTAMKCFQDEFWYQDYDGSKDYTLFYTKTELMEEKNAYLQNDVLSLFCECAFSCGKKLEEIEMTDSECSAVKKKEPNNRSLNKENKFSVHSCIFIDNFKSMLNDGNLSDVKLKTKRQSYSAHKSILGARSPVFKTMFSNDTKEKINECADIEDLKDDTLLCMLQYIYSTEVGELEWTSAIELYEAAYKYQILSLKDVCSSYLKNNLYINNTCEALVLADLHKDEDLKGFVQDFILRHGRDIIYSEEWEQLMETNTKLAAETMRLKFKE